MVLKKGRGSIGNVMCRLVEVEMMQTLLKCGIARDSRGSNLLTRPMLVINLVDWGSVCFPLSSSSFTSVLEPWWWWLVWRREIRLRVQEHRIYALLNHHHRLFQIVPRVHVHRRGIIQLLSDEIQMALKIAEGGAWWELKNGWHRQVVESRRGW